MIYPTFDAATAAGRPPRPYQVEMIETLKRERTWLDLDDMGLGKTLSVLLSILLGRGVLVICPASVRGLERVPGKPVGGWLAEAARCRPDLRRTRLQGNGKLRWPQPGELCVASYETARTSQVTTPTPGPVALVLDEAQAIKNPKSKQSQACDVLVKTVLEGGGTAWGLTGTPLTNDPEDLMSVLGILRLFNRAFPGGVADFGRVFQRHLETQVFGKPRCMQCKAVVEAQPTHCGVPVRKPKRVSAWVYGKPGPEAPERLRRVSLGRMLSDVVDLPEVVEVEHAAELDGAGLQALATLGKLSDEELAQAIEREGIASDPDSHVAKARAALAAAKRAVVGDVIDEVASSGERVVLFADHRVPVIETVEKRARWAGVLGGRAWIHGEADVRREVAIDRFARGELAGIALTLGSGGTGVDGLQRAARHLVLLEESWSPSLVKQAIGRLRRLGQTGTVVLHRLTTGHEVEERVRKVVERKNVYLDMVDESRAPKAPLGSW